MNEQIFDEAIEKCINEEASVIDLLEALNLVQFIIA